MNAGDARPKAMCFKKPIVVVKQVPAGELGGVATKPYTKTLVSFQSTGVTNISGVNNLPLENLYVTVKSRGKTPNRRYWGIEQNKKRATYLGHYYGVDNVDHMIKNAKIRYTTWKYWHAPFLHALSVAVIAAYNMYVECCKGGFDEKWFIAETDRLSFRDFWLELSRQMLTYGPRQQMYRGDENFRTVPKLGGKRKVGVRARYWKGEKGGVSIENFKIAKTSTRYSPSRLYSPLDDLEKHIASNLRRHHPGECAVCGRSTYWKCGLCNKRICLGAGGKGCQIALHNDSMFGLARCDFSEVLGG